MATTPSLAALAWYGWRAFWAELDPPNHEHEKKQTTKQPSLLILQTTVPNNKKQEITVLYSKQPSTLTPGWRTPEMPWSKDYKWLKTAWSCHFHMIVWGFIDPEVGKHPPKKKADLSKPIFFHSPQILRQTPLEIKFCTPCTKLTKCMFLKKKTAKRISYGHRWYLQYVCASDHYWAPSSGVRFSASSAWRIRASPATVLGMSEIPNKKCFTQPYSEIWVYI